ncbi:AraC family transcriptional regulator [Paenibacillus hemerocallicola]|nr:helix-turn-helix domain-containing protein [Paenibacillus hemerocallicola]
MTIDVAFMQTMNTIQVFNSIFGSRAPGWSFEKHYHSYCELLHCRSGEITLELEGHILVLRSGDWLVIKSRVKHRLWNDTDRSYYFFHAHFDIDDHGLRQLLHAAPYKHVSVGESAERLSPFLDELGRSLEELLRGHVPKRVLHLESVQRRNRFWVEQLPPHGKLALQAYVTLAIAEIVARQPASAAPLANKEEAAGPYSSPAEIDTAHAIERKLDEQVYTNVTITELAGRMGMSRTQFTKIFAKVYGISPRQYVSQQKMNAAKLLLMNTDAPIGEIAERLGFASFNHFSRQFRRWSGQPPSYYRPKYKLDRPPAGEAAETDEVQENLADRTAVSVSEAGP